MAHKPRRTVLLVGNPNVGKSLIFSRLTGIGVVTANYPGTTVEVKIGRFSYGGEEFEIIDMPGVYSLDAGTDAELRTAKLIARGDIVVHVIDATNLERNLKLTIQLARMSTPMVVCCNCSDEARHKGITIDHGLLSKELGLPVVPTSARYGTGIQELAAAISRATPPAAIPSDLDDWKLIGTIVGRVQRLSHRHHSLLEILSDFTLHPLGGIAAAAAVLGLSFWIIRSVGESLIARVLEPAFMRLYLPWITGLVSQIPFDSVQVLLAGKPGDIMNSFGILTTGIYITAVLVFPYFFAFYAVIGLLEDFGFLPLLAVTLDGLFHRIGLHGYSSIPVMLGMGCKVPAFMATRLLATRRERIITIALIMMSAPCMPQSAMIFSLGMPYGAAVIILIYATLFVVSLGVTVLLNRTMKGAPTDLFMEIPFYRVPSPRLMLQKLGMRTREYFRETIPMIILGVLLINILDMAGFIAALTPTAGRALAILLGLPADIASVVVLGFLRKDVSIAMLAPYHLTARQFVVASVFLVLYLPCIASFFSLLREAGWAGALRIVGIVFAASVVVAGALNVLLTVTGAL